LGPGKKPGAFLMLDKFFVLGYNNKYSVGVDETTKKSYNLDDMKNLITLPISERRFI